MRKPRFTAVPHEIIDDHLKTLSGPELKVLLLILRKTYGWNRDAQSIAFSAMAELTGLARGTCCEAVKALEALGLIRAERHSDEKYGKLATTYEPLFEDDIEFSPENRGVLSSEHEVFYPVNAVRNIEKDPIEKDLSKTSYNPPLENASTSEEEKPRASADFFFRLWRTVRGVKKISAGERVKVRERWASISISEEDFDVALDQFQAWLYGKDGVHDPLWVFLKDPTSWIPRDSASQERPTGASLPQPTTQDHPAPPGASNAFFDPIARWNELVPSAPCTDWSHRDPVAALKKAMSDPTFVEKFDEVCRVAYGIHKTQGSKANWLTFRWILKNQKETGTPNWWRLLTDMKGMTEPFQSGTGLNPAVEAGKRLMERRRLERETKEKEANGGGT